MKKIEILLSLAITALLIGLTKTKEEPSDDGMSPLLKYGILGENVDPNNPHDAFQNY